jgi:hypothetical protein
VKRILLYRFDRPPAEGVVRPDPFFAAPDIITANLEFMTVEGDIQNVSFKDVKAMCFVSEAGRPDLFTANNTFERRPKSAGLWVRFMMRDGDQLEGLLAHNLAEWPQTGYLLTPPRAGSGRQRVFLPRPAVISTELLGVIGAAGVSSGARKSRRHAAGEGQLKIFDQ